MQFLVNTNYEFMNHRRKAYIFSGILILISLVSIVAHRGLNYSIDFEGGSVLELRFDEPVPIEDIRSALGKGDIGNFEVQTFGDHPRDILVHVEETGLTGELGQRVVAALQQDFPDRRVEIRREESVGPRVGKELRSKALWAIIFANVGILIYVSWRFEFRFAAASVIALVHDVLITLGFFSITNREMSLTVLAAFLTIVGYSVNDKIVNFDRVREDLRLHARVPYDRLLNTAVNRTLSRTILTGGTTLVSILFLIFAGGEVIRDFSIALFIGIIVGTYSSIFIGIALALDWHNYDAARSKARSLARATK
jgi:preprotein translocase subunit SecF